MKRILNATNDPSFKKVTSVYILRINPSGDDTYLRKYFLMSDGIVHGSDLIDPRINLFSTGGIKHLDNLIEIKGYDNQHFGDEFI